MSARIEVAANLDECCIEELGKCVDKPKTKHLVGVALPEMNYWSSN